MKAYLLTLSMVLAATPSLACTSEELQAKAMQVSTKMQQMAAKDPQKAGEIGQKVAKAQAGGVSNLDEACKLYDGILVDLEK